MKTLKEIFKSRSFQICLFVVLIQQVLVATGTYLMGDIAAQISTEGFNLVKGGVLFLCLVLSGSLFHYLMKYHLVAAQKDVLLQFFQKYISRNYSRPEIWRNPEEKTSRHDIMVREGQDSISQSVQFAADTVATGLNIIFNTVSVILITSPVMGVFILIAGLLGLLIVHLADKAIADRAQKEMVAQNDVNGFLALSWDNIVLGNKTPFQRWNSKFKELFGQSKSSSLDNVKVNDGIVGVAAFVTSFIVIATVFTLVYLNQKDLVKVVGLLVMLPRSMQIVMHIQVIQSYWAHWKYLLQRLDLTEKTFEPIKSENLDQFISTDKIQITGAEKTWSMDQLDVVLAQSSGRFVITGENGAGKSTLLLKMKQQLSEDGLYIPAHHNLELSESVASKSSGEVALHAVRDALVDEARVILLDEWDANLSKDNHAKLDREINDLSISRLVIEIRHHIPVV
ncbi:MAG: hypothetical protein ACM3MG_07795 [Bacillota bacterium]